MKTVTDAPVRVTLARSGAVIYVSYARNSEAAVQAADNLLEQSAARMMSAIDRLIEPIVTMADTIVLRAGKDEVRIERGRGRILGLF